MFVCGERGSQAAKKMPSRVLMTSPTKQKKYFPPCINTYALMGQLKLQARLQYLVFNSIRWLIYLEEDYYKNNPEKVLVSMVGNDAIDAIANEVEMLSVKMTLLTIGALKDRKGDSDENMLEDKFPFIKEENVKPLIDELFVEAQE